MYHIGNCNGDTLVGTLTHITSLDNHIDPTCSLQQIVVTEIKSHDLDRERLEGM